MKHKRRVDLTLTPVLAFVQKAGEELGMKMMNGGELYALAQKIPFFGKMPTGKEKGLEMGLMYSKNGRDVIAWIPWLVKAQKERERGTGWVVIMDSRFPAKPSFSSFPILRTKNFFTTLFSYAKAMVEMVDNWPEPCCGEDPHIKLVKNGQMHSYAFKHLCRHPMKTYSVYQGLSEENKKFLESKFKRYYEYQKREQEIGREHVPMRMIRSKAKKKKWAEATQKRQPGSRVVKNNDDDLVHEKRFGKFDGVDPFDD
jgi:hypothetical protein